MSDLICLSCVHYNFSTEHCHKLGHYISSKDETYSLASCMYHEERKQMSSIVRKDQAIWWGADEHDKNIQWYLCPICHTWFKGTDIHYCTSSDIPLPPEKSEDFINEKEMEI